MVFIVQVGPLFDILLDAELPLTVNPRVSVPKSGEEPLLAFPATVPLNKEAAAWAGLAGLPDLSRDMVVKISQRAPHPLSQGAHLRLGHSHSFPHLQQKADASWRDL